MKQINFRVSDDEYELAATVAKILGKPVSAVMKDLGFKALRDASIDLVLDLYKNGTIGLKRAWVMTGLAFHEFTRHVMERGIDPPDTADLVERAIASARGTRIEDMFPGKRAEELRALLKIPDA